MFNLYSLKVFSSVLTPASPFSTSESNFLVYKPHLQFLAQNLSKKDCGLYMSVYGICTPSQMGCYSIIVLNLIVPVYTPR